MLPLLILGCSATKRAVDRARFVDLYNGPLWQQARSYLPAANIAALSAEHGLLEPNAEIETYDRVMDEDRLQEIINDAGMIDRTAQLIRKFGRALIVGGELYKLFGLMIVALHPDLIDRVHFACGSYLQQRKALRAFCEATTN